MVGKYFNTEEDARRVLGYDSPETMAAEAALYAAEEQQPIWGVYDSDGQLFISRGLTYPDAVADRERHAEAAARDGRPDVSRFVVDRTPAMGNALHVTADNGTRQSVSHNPKRQMDRDVAQYIFEQTIQLTRRPGTFDDFIVVPDPASGQPQHKPVPRYSSDLTAAWLVVGWMQQNGLAVHLSWENRTGVWRCTFATPSETVTSTDTVAAMAICKAARQAQRRYLNRIHDWLITDETEEDDNVPF
jgi:hypothetical protein